VFFLMSIFITNCDMLNLETSYLHQNWNRWMHTVAIILSFIFCVSKIANDAGRRQVDEREFVICTVATGI